MRLMVSVVDALTVQNTAVQDTEIVMVKNEILPGHTQSKRVRRASSIEIALFVTNLPQNYQQEI